MENTGENAFTTHSALLSFDYNTEYLAKIRVDR